MKHLKQHSAALLKYLRQFHVDERNDLFDKVVGLRTNYMTLVLEDIFQPNNASAVLRSADCFGVQTVHIIENRNKYTLDKEVTMSANQWLTMKKYNEYEQNTASAINTLKNQGYRIVATTPHIDDTTLADFDVSKGKFALMFGTELTGLSDVAMDMADEFVKIPMLGFIESFNISVSAAIILHTLRNKINDSEVNWQLSDDERTEVLISWLKRRIRYPKQMLERFYQEIEKNQSLETGK